MRTEDLVTRTECSRRFSCCAIREIRKRTTKCCHHQSPCISKFQCFGKCITQEVEKRLFFLLRFFFLILKEGCVIREKESMPRNTPRPEMSAALHNQTRGYKVSSLKKKMHTKDEISKLNLPNESVEPQT